MTDDRAQLVLLAAAVLALALVPVVAAYLQLGYGADVRAGVDAEPTRDAERVLERGLARAAADVPATYDWSDRENATRAVRANLSVAVGAVRNSTANGAVAGLGYDAAAARRLADRACPGGPDRRFGPCVARDGLVVQQRANRTHVVAAAFEFLVVTDDGRTRATLVVHDR